MSVFTHAVLFRERERVISSNHHHRLTFKNPSCLLDDKSAAGRFCFFLFCFFLIFKYFRGQTVAHSLEHQKPCAQIMPQSKGMVNIAVLASSLRPRKALRS